MIFLPNKLFKLTTIFQADKVPGKCDEMGRLLVEELVIYNN